MLKEKYQIRSFYNQSIIVVFVSYLTLFLGVAFVIEYLAALAYIDAEEKLKGNSDNVKAAEEFANKTTVISLFLHFNYVFSFFVVMCLLIIAHYIRSSFESSLQRKIITSILAYITGGVILLTLKPF